MNEKLSKDETVPMDRHETCPDCGVQLVRIAPRHPVSSVRWVPIELVDPNDYNPNAVARTEMQLLITSILADGYTQPIVTVQDPETGHYVIVDGFHRYYACKVNAEIRIRTGGLLPIVVIDKPMNERMASTIRHNRARGKHNVQGMATMVFAMLENGWDDVAICKELGMEAEELLRLKHVTGFSKLFEGTEYRQSWTTKNQILLQKQAYAGTRPKENDLPAAPEA